MFFVEIFGGKDFRRRALFDQETSTLDDFFFVHYGCHDKHLSVDGQASCLPVF